MQKATIRIHNLALQTIIGCNDWERHKKQDIIINLSMEFDATKACMSDSLDDTLDYRAMKKKIIKEVENSSFFLVEKLTSHILNTIMENPKVEKAFIKIDKPHALRFADSVSVEMSASR